MERNTMSKHFINDRIERAAYIAQTVGFGEVIKEITYYRDGVFQRKQLTETGVIIVRNGYDTIITMFIGSVDQIKGIYNRDRIPSWIINKAKKNKKYMIKQP